MINIEHIKAAILARLPEDGSQIGNQKMQTQLVMVNELKLSEEDYRRACEELVAEGQIARGRGRGGAIRLAEEKAEVGNNSGAALPGSGGKKKKQREAAGAASTGNPGIGDAAGTYGNYRHDAAAISRPDVGVQAQFNARREPKTYRYDSSLAPELCWDENAEREFAEWLLNLVAEAAEKGESEVFAKEQVWKGTGDRFASLSQCIARLKSLAQPFLNWAGKAERQQIRVPTAPLFVHERHSTETILKTLESHRATGTTADLFGDENEKDIADRLNAYSHTEEWQNRMILGDSLQVMNSLLEYEGLGGQVQMIYIDPPYGVKFGSNFQPFVRKRDVKHGKDDEMIREPEMVKAYRDTWELGLHSYLSYLRDRLLLARELLAESGSAFVQISDENLHHIREVMDEVFGEENFISQITLSKTTGSGMRYLDSVADYVLWYGKDTNLTKYRQIYMPKASGVGGKGPYRFVELSDGKRRPMTPSERRGETDLPDGAKVYRIDQLTSQTTAKTTRYDVEFRGRTFKCGRRQWATPPSGMENLIQAGRVEESGSSIVYVRYYDDFPLSPLRNVWTDTSTGGFSEEKLYVVQTSQKTIERCLLMASDPGDLVLDPTCGSGTTAYVAEQWGRRWITCDTSRVPLALARQRLLTATFPWYELGQPQRGPAGGFVYKRQQNRKGAEVGGLVPHITLKSIASDEDPKTITLVDRPEVSKGTTRVCGPFSIEATIQAAHSLAAQGEAQVSEQSVGQDARTYLDRMIEIVRRSKSLNLPGNRVLELESVRPIDSEHLHAEAVDENGKRAALAFGPEDGAIHSQQVFDAASEAYFLKYDQLYLFGFAIQAKARELVDDRARLRLPCTYISVNPDVAMDDLLKTSHTDQLFSITGLPDGKLKRAGKGDDGTPLYTAEITGLDTFLPDSMKTESLPAENLPCWMLDINYNGMVFCASQVFFPRTQAWDNLQKSLKGQFNESLWDHLAGTESEPFAAGSNGQVAIKVIDDRGNELMRVFSVEEAQ
jgi:adenine-specific DNA-methyltransferase